MKKLFTEPEVEILTFLCDGLVGADSVTTGGESVPGGSDDDGAVPLS